MNIIKIALLLSTICGTAFALRIEKIINQSKESITLRYMENQQVITRRSHVCGIIHDPVSFKEYVIQPGEVTNLELSVLPRTTLRFLPTVVKLKGYDAYAAGEALSYQDYGTIVINEQGKIAVQP